MEDNTLDGTARNLDHLTDFLNNELDKKTSLASQIPDEAHVFHGAHEDISLTQANLKLASKILLGMTLGYIEDAPLIMIFEQKSGQQTLLDLSAGLQKERAQIFIEQFQEQNQQEMAAKINQLMAA